MWPGRQAKPITPEVRAGVPESKAEPDSVLTSLQEVFYVPAVIKTIGSSGQITLGKQYAGQKVVVDQIGTGLWMIKVGEFIPTDGRWFQEPEVMASIDRGLRWIAENPPAESDLEVLEQRLGE